MKDLYKVLEVDRKASIDVIEKAYKVLAKKNHPDLQSTQEAKKQAEEKIKKINEAYEILKDEEKRRKYDLELEQEEKRNTINNTKYNNSGVNGVTYNKVNYNRNVGTTNNTKCNNRTNYQSNYDQNNQNSDTELTDKQRKKLNKKLQRKMEDEYLRAYGDYLTKNGYKVAFRVNWRRLPYLLIIILVVIAIGAFLWYFPITNKYLVSLYEDNIIIKKIVDVIISLFK